MEEIRVLTQTLDVQDSVTEDTNDSREAGGGLDDGNDSDGGLDDGAGGLGGNDGAGGLGGDDSGGGLGDLLVIGSHCTFEGLCCYTTLSVELALLLDAVIKGLEEDVEEDDILMSDPKNLVIGTATFGDVRHSLHCSQLYNTNK
ncbi:Hypothetical predicted protein [Paramuricea clavata]|uniref:Uncharacterized protein n=1 Tax=Paramuricea clavata TaxID=317549 RepID=A0A6S7H1I8_PARCT|nr:Hypothetical predicted protein [Paramuricea clavata]